MSRSMRTVYPFILSFLIPMFALAQTDYKIQIKVQGWKDTTVYLGFYYGESTRIADTARVNPVGEFVFQHKKTLPEGIYFVVLGKTRVFDFVVGHDQHFALSTVSSDLLTQMKVSGDPDNTLFFEDQMYLRGRHQDAEAYLKIIRDSTIREKVKKESAKKRYSTLNADVASHQLKIIGKFPTMVTARIFKASKPIDPPPIRKKADGTVDSSFQLRYYRAHFFDNFDLADEALIRTPHEVYQKKVKEYLDKLFPPHPDSVSRAIDQLVAKARKNPETFKYLVTTCLFLYQAPEIMGLDQVFVNTYNKYFVSGEMDYWANGSLKKSLQEIATKISQGQIGTKGPDLIMLDTDLKPRSLYDIHKNYTIIFFFSPDCSHCRAETPGLVNFYSSNKDKYGLEVYAVSVDSSMKKLRDFCKEMKTTWITVDGPRTYQQEPFYKLYFAESWPTVYILDEKKTVIARKLPVDQIGTFLERYDRNVRPAR